CSPYLDLLMRREADWLRGIVGGDLDAVFAEILNDISGDSFQALSDNLRTAKRRGALLAGLADLGGLWSLDQVTGSLTDLADRAVQVSLDHLVKAEIARGKLPGCTGDNAAGMVVLAMGKMGARELNYSSDIDLIVLFDETRHDPEDYGEVRASFIRITQRMVKLLSAVTGGGYVFRTDLRLRPDPSSTPVCMAMEPAERYYESLGRTWERAAFIKARPCAGAIDAGWAFLDRLKPFIWRKYLDFAAIQDAHDMRLRIREHKGLHGAVLVPGHNMKLGRGGIREIEFFTQTRQIISGGRDNEIRQRETLKALKALVNNGWVEADIASYLNDAYVAHRTLEHRLQMLEDAQTHVIPESLERRERLAAFCGTTDLTSFEAEITERLQKVHDLTEKFFAGDDVATEAPEFERPDFVEGVVEKWTTLPSMRSERASQIFARLKPEILSRLADSTSPEEALIQFDAFLSGLPAGVQLFSLFEANPPLLDLLIDICATAPQLARYLGRNSKVFDAVVSSDFFESLPEFNCLNAELKAEIETAEDYEDTLDITRRWVKEKQFSIGVHLLRQISTADEAAIAYSDVAEACLANLFPAVCQNFSRRYGSPPGKGAAVIAMGKLGSREMSATSDLDLIMVYDAQGAENSEGDRPLAVSTYFARLTQAVLSALTVPTSEGALYEVDMRLRPSGRMGPVATSINAFKEYQMNEAWTWEHLALSRARVVAGREDLERDVRNAMRAALRQPHDRAKVIGDVQEMRAKLAEEKADNPWEMKHGAGWLMDIELVLQTGAVLYGITGVERPADMLPELVTAGWITGEQAGAISAALKLFTSIQQVARLAVDGPIDPQSAGRGFRDLLVKVAKVDDIAALEVSLRDTADAMAVIIDEVLTV
ncbi:MAG: glutamine-synthetase adenylyltransferase, partial [Rhodobacteraceae bacterium]|nr:glutamine-synthetase adenylyltransferase [Paracoccaceae bacterium]